MLPPPADIPATDATARRARVAASAADARCRRVAAHYGGQVHPDAAAYFAASARLSPRTEPGLPPARRIATEVVAAVVVAAVTLGVGVGASLGVPSGMATAAAAVLVGAAVVVVRRLDLVREARTRLSALGEEVRGPNTFPVRSTVGFDGSRPVERPASDDRRRPGRAFQVVTLNEVGFEVRERPSGGPAGAAFVPWADVASIVTGSAAFTDASQRAVLVAAEVQGRPCLIGLSPVDGERISPVADGDFLRLVGEMRARADAARALSDRRARE